MSSTGRPAAAARTGPGQAGAAPASATQPSEAVDRGEGSGAALLPGGGTPVRLSRRKRRTVTRVDPWTVLRLSFVLAIAVAVITFVAVVLLWGLLEGGGVFGAVERSLDDVFGEGSVTITQYFSFGQVVWVAFVLGVVDIVLITALATLGAFLYNLGVGIVGGVEVTVNEEP